MSSQTTGQSAASLLRHVMDEDGLSNEQLAVDLSVNERTIRRWLKGESAINRNAARRLGVRFDREWRDFYDEQREAA